MTFKVGDNSEAVRISNDGNVGIGETNPTGYRLIVKNTAEDMVKLHNSTDGLDSLISFTNPGGTLGRIQGLDNGGLQFDTGNNAGGLNTNVMYMANDGNVGIGETSPGQKLEVDGNVKGDTAMFNVLNNSANSANIIYRSGTTTIVGGGSSSNKLYVLDNGDVGVNDSSPSYKLDADGTIRATGDVIAYSDRRVKENIKTIDNALDKVKKLRGVSYNRKDIEDKSTKIGVIAQEVKNILPEVVEQDLDDKYSVAYGNMAGLFIEAVKELKAEIEELKSNKCNCNK